MAKQEGEQPKRKIIEEKSAPERGIVVFDKSAETYVKAVASGDREKQLENAPVKPQEKLKEWNPEFMVD